MSELGELLIMGPPLLNHVEDGSFFDVLDALERREHHGPWYTVHALSREEKEAVPILTEAWCRRPHDHLLRGGEEGGRGRQFHWVPAGSANWRRSLSLLNCVVIIHPDEATASGCEEVVTWCRRGGPALYSVTFGEDGEYHVHRDGEVGTAVAKRRHREEEPMTETEFKDMWK